MKWVLRAKDYDHGPDKHFFQIYPFLKKILGSHILKKTSKVSLMY
jgi:hypothetical protein